MPAADRLVTAEEYLAALDRLISALVRWRRHIGSLHPSAALLDQVKLQRAMVARTAFAA